MITSLYVWRVPARAVPAALWRVARDPARLRRGGVRFAKLLGTGTGFTVGRIDPTRWAALTVSDAVPPEFPGWARIARSTCRLDLLPLTSRGSWAGRHPFPAPAACPVQPGAAPVLVLTRARLRASRAVSFWRAMHPVAAALSGSTGLLAAFSVGEAPLGWQGTVSVWRTPADLVRFAYRHPEHRRAIERTGTSGWYAEELFARFAVTKVVGDTRVIGWVDDQKEWLSG